MRISIALSGLGLFAAVLPAQVPPGWGIYSRLNHTKVTTTGSGLTIFHPHNGTGLSECHTNTPYVHVTNLPPQLGYKDDKRIGGANCVLVRDADGSVIASTLQDPLQSVSIYHLILNGTRVARSQAYLFGTVVKTPKSGTGRGAIDQMAWLDDDRIVFSYRDIKHSTWPTATGVGIFSLSKGTFTRIPIAFPSTIGSINALALTRDKRTIFMGFFGPNSIHSVGIAGGTAKGYPPMPNGPYLLDVDEQGMVYIATFSLGLWRLDPSKGTYTQLNMIRLMNGMTIDRLSGHVLLAHSHTGLWPSHMFRYLPSSKGLLGVPGMPKYDLICGIAIRSSVIPMKTGSAAYRWQLEPNPGGAPLLGNRDFSLTLSTTAKPLQSGLLVSPGLAAAPVRIGGADLWLRAPVLATVPMTINAPRTQVSVKLPIPVLKSLCGVSVYAQSYSVDSTGLSSTRPLQIAFQ